MQTNSSHQKSLPDTLQDMCHPAIADSRIMYIDDKAVAFYYIDTKTKRKIDVVMKIEDFMLALLQHIPDRQFKMIRHYGTYSRRTKKIYAKAFTEKYKQLQTRKFNQK